MLFNFLSISQKMWKMKWKILFHILWIEIINGMKFIIDFLLSTARIVHKRSIWVLDWIGFDIRQTFLETFRMSFLENYLLSHVLLDMTLVGFVMCYNMLIT